MKYYTNRISLALLLTCIVFGAGCSTTNDVIRVKESGSEGTTKVYSVTVDQAWDIARTVFKWEGSDAIEEYKAEGYMLTSSGPNMVSWGAVMGAWVEPVAGDSSKVTVVTKRRITINVATTLTESKFHKRFEEAVAIVKSGKPLPRIAP